MIDIPRSTASNIPHREIEDSAAGGIAFQPIPTPSDEGCEHNSLPLASGRVIIPSRSDNVLRTQISLDEQDYKLVKREAAALGVSVAEYVRRALQSTLPPSGQPRWMRYAGLVESGNPQSSQSIDEIVYGNKD